MKNYKFTTAFVTVYLLIYTVLHHSGAPVKILGWMFVLSPFLVLWMGYSILRYAPYRGRELKENEEFGYGELDTDNK